MKKLILIIIFLSFLQAKAQTSVYHPFPDSNAVWNDYYYSCCWANCAPPPFPNPEISESFYSHFLYGDTLINGTNYHKIYSNGYNHLHCAYGGSPATYTYTDSNLYGAIRQDTTFKKIYFYQFITASECLLYNFNIMPGDTLTDDCGFGLFGIVSSIDSILIGNNFRKKINLANAIHFLIEGIGSTAGLFGHHSMFFELSTQLMCFKQNNQTLYPDTTTVCDLITVSVPDVGNELQEFKIFPNPALDELNISLKLEGPTDVEMQLFNSLGQVVKEIAEEKLIAGENKIKISVEDIPIGIYYLKAIINENQVIGKIVKY